MDTRTTRDLIRSYIAEQVDVLLRREVELRAGLDVVHPTRVATRRVRSVLHACSRYLDPARTTYLDHEIRWYAGVLGVVRDREVLRVHLARGIGELAEDLDVGPLAARMDAMLSAERDAGKAALCGALDSPRYNALVDELRRWRSDLPFAADAVIPERPQRFIRTAKRKVRRRLAAAGDSSDGLHRARKAAKRARYVAELAQPLAGKKAAKAVAWSKRVQRHLGRVQDSVVAAEFVRRAARVAETAGESTFSYGVLHERELRRAARATRRARQQLT